MGLQKDLHDILSVDTLESILKSYLDAIRESQKLTNDELRFVLDWSHKLSLENKQLVSNYINRHLQEEASSLEMLKEYFDTLRFPEVVKLLFQADYIQQTLNFHQKKSFEMFLNDDFITKSISGSRLIEYVNNLFLLEAEAFTSGQKSQAQSFLYDLDYSEVFENEFEKLLLFLTKCEIEFPSAICKVLDKQLGNLISKNESEVIAKAYNNKYGYVKYINLVEENSKKLNINGFVNYRKLKTLISKFEEAVEILSSHEHKRGSFWKGNINKLDAVKFKKFNHPQYKVGVAFYVGNFVFCDYGPTGNKIFIYDKGTFSKNVEKFSDWKATSYLTDKLYPNTYSHVGDWQTQTLNLISKAKNR